jgi:hypothetical protein
MRRDSMDRSLHGRAWQSNISPRAISAAVMPGGGPDGYSIFPDTSRDLQEAQRPSRQLCGIGIPAASAAARTFSPGATGMS